MTWSDLPWIHKAQYHPISTVRIEERPCHQIKSTLLLNVYRPSDCPISPQGCFIFSLVKYVPLTYNKVYRYPDWAIGLGWGLALSSMICIPLVIAILLCRTEGPLRVVSMGHRAWVMGGGGQIVSVSV